MAGPGKLSRHSGTLVSLSFDISCTNLTSLTDLFDGGMIALSLYTLIAFHPGPLLFAVPLDSSSMESKSGTTESLPMVAV